MRYILENLAIGNFDESKDPPSGISGLLCVAEERPVVHTSLPHHKVPIIDMQPIPTEQLAEAIEWINQHIQDHRIMVFCNAGVGRSPSTVIAYLCVHQGFSFGQAVEFVATRKPDISILPNLILNIRELQERKIS